MLLKTKKKIYNLSERTHIMGILNVTPDSFSDGGSYICLDQAISLEIELQRVIPVIRAIKKEVNIPISIDTYKAEVARQAIEAGAEIINDVWGAKKEPEIAAVAARNNVPIILMHNRTNKNYS